MVSSDRAALATNCSVPTGPIITLVFRPSYTHGLDGISDLNIPNALLSLSILVIVVSVLAGWSFLPHQPSFGTYYLALCIPYLQLPIYNHFSALMWLLDVPRPSVHNERFLAA